MSKFPIALSIVVLCLLVTIGQNWSPSISIVFLGTTSIALPLGIWLGLAIAAGAMTALAIAWLLQLASSLQPNFSRPSIRASSPPPAPERAQRTWDDRTAAESMGDRSKPPIDIPTDEPYEPMVGDDMKTGKFREEEPLEEWDNEEEWVGQDVAEVKSEDVYPQEDSVNPTSFEVTQEPIPTYQEGSIYSYSYRDRKTETGRTDDIFAAADDTQKETPKPVTPEENPLESEIVEPFPETFPESFEDNGRSPSEDRPPQSQPSSPSSPSPDDDWTSSSKQNKEDW